MLTRLIVVINLQYNVMCRLHQKKFLNVKGEKKNSEKTQVVHTYTIFILSIFLNA